MCFISPRAGADIVGVNCHLDPLTCVRTVKLMKEGLEKAGLKAHFMIQPLGFHTPECNHTGYMSLPEFPFGQHFGFLGVENHETNLFKLQNCFFTDTPLSKRCVHLSTNQDFMVLCIATSAPITKSAG